MPLNPFDLPFDADSDSPDMFMDVTALQAVLPNADLSTSFVDGLPETWFSNNASAYVPPGSHGKLNSESLATIYLPSHSLFLQTYRACGRF